MWQYSSSISWICEDISQARETFHMIKSAFAEILNNFIDDLWNCFPLYTAITYYPNQWHGFYGITRLRKEDG